MSRYKHVIAVIVLVIISTIGTFLFFKDVVFQLPVAASAEAGPIDTMFSVHFSLQAFLFALIMVIMLYSVYAFRRKPGDEEDAAHVHGNTGLEILWTVVPTIVVIGFGIYGVVVLADLLAPKDNERSIEVIGRQWAWKFSYPDIEDKSATELGLLVNEPVVLRMQSEDVLHNFWVPEFRVKQDLLPGRWVDLRFTPTEEGVYKVRCAEICGLQHSGMLADVLVMNEADYRAWEELVISQPSDEELANEMTPLERGQYWYEEVYQCNSCHTLDGTPSAGPTWLGLYGRQEELSDGTSVTVDDDYLRESILAPNVKITAGFNANIMSPDFAEQFAEAEDRIEANTGVRISIVDDYIEFIKNVGAEGAAE